LWTQLRSRASQLTILMLVVRVRAGIPSAN
jgi:hypothetical protein